MSFNIKRHIDTRVIFRCDSPVKASAKPCKCERKPLQTSPEQTESCAPDSMLSSDTLVKAFVQMIANTRMNKQCTEAEKQVHQTS